MSTDSTDVSRASTGELETDFHYRDKIAAVEPYGVDAIPDSERHGKPVSQFFIWFAAGMNFPIMVLGFLAVSYGLSLTSSVTAIVAGSLVGSIVMGILSRMGGRLGVAQQIQARGPLGFFGNFLPVAYVNVFAGIGWAAVTVILGGQALQALVPAIPYWLGTLVLVVLQLIVAVFGYNMIHYLERILAVVLFFGFLLITVVSVSRGWQGGFDTNPHAPYWVGTSAVGSPSGASSCPFSSPGGPSRRTTRAICPMRTTSTEQRASGPSPVTSSP